MGRVDAAGRVARRREEWQAGRQALFIVDKELHVLVCCTRHREVLSYLRCCMACQARHASTMLGSPLPPLRAHMRRGERHCLGLTVMTAKTHALFHGEATPDIPS